MSMVNKFLLGLVSSVALLCVCKLVGSKIKLVGKFTFCNSAMLPLNFLFKPNLLVRAPQPGPALVQSNVLIALVEV